VTPHGHDPHARKIAAEDRDVAVQVARRGFSVIAPAARGTSSTCIPDINGRHDNRNCRSQLIHALFAGRTAIGERVWGLSRLIDWAEGRSDIDTSTVPGILRFGEIWDIAVLTAPRYLCIVNGKLDHLFPVDEVERAVAGVRRAYEVAGVPERVSHVYGPAGHRFYADFMWPFVEAALR